jgi:uncharacterized protein
MKNLSIVDWTTLIVLTIGGLNWGMIALFNVDLVSTLFGEMTVISRLVYGLVGISAVYLLLSATASAIDTNESPYESIRKATT